MLFRRPADFRLTGRKTIIERIATSLGINSLFLRRPPLDYIPDPDSILSPAQAKVELLAKIDSEGAFQDKSVLGSVRQIHLKDILKDQVGWKTFVGGDYCKLYLAPWDLHFLLFPTDGVVQDYYYSPGWILPLVFFRSGEVLNERLCIRYETQSGFSMMIILVGSFMVNGIHHLFVQGSRYHQGDDLGYFSLGSTVILVFPRNSIEWNCKTGQKVKIGDRLAIIK